MELLPTIFICITVIASLVLVLRTVEKLYTPLPPQEIPEMPDLTPLENEIADIRTKLGSIQVASGFRKMK